MITQRKLKVALAAVENRKSHAINMEDCFGGMRIICRCGYVGRTHQIHTCADVFVGEAIYHAGTDAVWWKEADDE